MQRVVDCLLVITSVTAEERIKKREGGLKRRAENQKLKKEKEETLKMLKEKRATKQNSEL